MKKTINLISVICLLSSCNSGGGGPSAPVKPLSEQLSKAQSATDFSASIIPNNFTVIKAKLSRDEQKERYLLGCKTQGESVSDSSKLDPNLAAGHSFRMQEGRSALLTRDSSQIAERQIIAIEAQKLVTGINFETILFGSAPFTSIDQVFISKPHITTTENFITKPDGTTQSDYNFVPNYTQAAQDYVQSHPSENNAYLSCSTSYDVSKPSKYSVDRISYQINGRIIGAYLVKNSQEGEISCEMRKYGDAGNANNQTKLGLGHSESIEIYSNDVIDQGRYFCGGSNLFNMKKFVLNSGKVIKVDVTKILSAPVR